MPQRHRRTREEENKFRISDFGFRIGWRCSFVFSVCFVVSSCLIVAAQCAAPQEVVPVDGAAFRGELVSIDGGGRVTFRESDGKKKDGAVRTLSLEELVRWGNPVAPRAQTIVVLADGGRIVTAADWTGGATVKLAGGEVVVASDMWDEVRLPRGLVSGVVFAQQRRAEDREKLVEKVRGESSQTEAADAVLLTNGDRLTGKLTELDRGSLAIETRGGVAKAPLSRVEAIAFGGDRPQRAATLPSPAKRGEVCGWVARWIVGLCECDACG